jgi:hypothetical protein
MLRAKQSPRALIGITEHGDAPLEGFQIMLRSASNE